MAGRKRTKTSGTPASIREALKKATTEMLVLYVLRRKSMYTYEMMQEIDRMSEGKITFNTLYQAIYRLQSFPPIIEEEGEGGIGRQSDSDLLSPSNEAGEDYLQKLIAEYRSFTAAVDQILSQDEVKQVEECS